MNTSTHLDQFRLLSQYNSGSNDRLYTLLSSLTEEERQRNLGAFFGTIHGTLSHLCWAIAFGWGDFQRAQNTNFQH
ncbi:MAG: hypothetical protein HC895_14425 [Leptolyngbyaceae cyanobacterium SM1_3_5]|nr:hypothetical protein [Leptolyngbyaceae cyanobacterium SM1_3_5]